MGGVKVVDRGCSALESGVFVVTSCGEAARRGGGSVSKIFLAVPLSCRVSAASLVSVCRAWKGVFKHGNRSAVTRCHFFCVSSSASGKLRDASVGNLRGDSRAVL